jgi:hypothetical protein
LYEQRLQPRSHVLHELVLETSLRVRGDAEKDNRQKTKHAQSWVQVVWELGWIYTSMIHLQQVYYIQWLNEVEQQF